MTVYAYIKLCLQHWGRGGGVNPDNIAACSVKQFRILDRANIFYIYILLNMIIKGSKVHFRTQNYTKIIILFKKRDIIIEKLLKVQYYQVSKTCVPANITLVLPTFKCKLFSSPRCTKKSRSSCSLFLIVCQLFPDKYRTRSSAYKSISHIIVYQLCLSYKKMKISGPKGRHQNSPLKAAEGP